MKSKVLVIDHLSYTTDKGFPHTKAGSTVLNPHLLTQETNIMTTPPTNEPKMPEVIYAYTLPSGIEQQGNWHTTKELPATIYHRTDKVQELKEALRECIEAMRATRIATKSIVENAPAVQQLRLSKEADEKVEKAYTNASNLLK